MAKSRGLFGRLFRSRNEPISEKDLSRWGGEPSWVGIPVGRSEAVAIPAVWACVRLISETMASLPLALYRSTADGKERATDHPLYGLLHDQPNPVATSFLWRETGQAHAMLVGNHYSQIIKDRGLYPTQLWPLDPECMTVIPGGGTLRYLYRVSGAPDVALMRDDVLHVPGLGWDGVKGMSVIAHHAQTLGAAIAGDRYAAEFFGNSSRPDGFITMAGSLKDASAQRRMQQSWDEAHGAWGNKHRTAILEQGAEWKPMTIPPEQAQFIEARKLSRQEVASIFRVPPHLIGDVDRSTSWGTGIEQQTIGFVVYTLMPWLVRWEQCLNQQLLMPEERDRYYFKFELKGLLRGDMAARTSFYNAMLDRGVFHADDVLELEDMNPQEKGAGKVYFIAANMQTKDRAIDPPEPKAAPATPAPRMVRAEVKRDSEGNMVEVRPVYGE